MSDDIDRSFAEHLETEGFIQIRNSPEVDILLKALEPKILNGEVIGASVNYRAQDWHIFLLKAFYEKHKNNPESLEGVVKRAVEQLYIEEQRSTFIGSEEDMVVLEEFADSETKKAVLWDQNGACIVQHFDEGKNGVYPSFREIIYPLNRSQLLIYKKEQEVFVLDKSMKLLLPARDYFTKVGVAQKYKDIAFAALSLMPVEPGQPFGLELVEKDGRIMLPPLDLVYSQNWYTQKLKEAISLSDDKALLEQFSGELWQISSAKQRADLAMIIGASIFNAVNGIRKLGLKEVVIHLAGATSVGKSWVVQRALHLYFGFNLLNGAILNSDVFSSPFRFESVVSATNLPILIDDAAEVGKQLVSLLKAKAGGAIGARGHADQTVSTYEMRATIVTTAQSNVYLGAAALADDMALSTRLYVNFYEEGDADSKQKVAHDLFAAKVKSGGLVYLWLSEHTADELQEIVLSAYKVSEGNSKIAAILIGLGFLGKLNAEAVEQIKVESEGGADPREDAIVAIKNDFEMLRTGRWPDPKMTTSLDMDEDWMYISSMYLQYVNHDSRHPLYGKFKNLGSMKELAPVVDVKPDVIYDRTARHKFGGVAACFAKIPANAVNVSGYTEVTPSVTKKIKEIMRDNKDIVTQLHKLHTTLYTIGDAPIKGIENVCNSVTSVTSDDKARYTNGYTESAGYTKQTQDSNILLDSPIPNSSFQENETNASAAPAGEAMVSVTFPSPSLSAHVTSPTVQAAGVPSPTPATGRDPKLLARQKVLCAVRHSAELGIPFWEDAAESEPNPALQDDLAGLFVDEIKKILVELEKVGDIYSPRPGSWRVVRADDVDE